MAAVTLLPKHRSFLPLESFTAPSAKRRRCSTEDVLRELSDAGLEQPVVASLEHLRKRAAEAPDVHAKRLRLAHQRPTGNCCQKLDVSLPEDALLQSLQLLAPPSTNALAVTESRSSFRLPTRLLPSSIPGSLATPLLPPLEFTQTEGWAWAALPKCWQVVLSAPWSHSTVAVVAVDAHGTAYLASAEGQVLAAAPAVDLTRRHSVELQLEPLLLDRRPSPTPFFWCAW